ncbi:unnamed protein product, partial [Ectocarpus sp. 4 AP-2014]
EELEVCDFAAETAALFTGFERRELDDNIRQATKLKIKSDWLRYDYEHSHRRGASRTFCALPHSTQPFYFLCFLPMTLSSSPSIRRSSSPTRRTSAASRRSSSSSSPSRRRRASAAAAAATAADRKNRAASHTTPSRGGGGDAGVNANAGSGSVEGWMSRKRREFPCASSSRSSDSGGGSNLRGAAGGGNGGGSGQKQTTGAMDMEVEERGGGGEKRRGVDIASFSPYAARLGWGGSGSTNSPGDEVGRATARLAGLQFEHGDGDDGDDGDDQEWAMESPAKKHHHDHDTYCKDSASPAPTEGVSGLLLGRMHFFKEADAPPPPPPPPALTAVERSPETTAAARAGASAARAAAAAAAAAAAVIPVENMTVEGMPAQNMAITSAPSSYVGGLHQEGGDESMASPPSKAAATERRTLVVYPPECLLHMGVEDHENHQEKPKRLELLCGEQGALRRTTFQGGLEWVDPSFIEPALITDLLRVHEYDYLVHIQASWS